MIEIAGVVGEEHCVENSGNFVLKIELLLTVLSNFERQEALKGSYF